MSKQVSSVTIRSFMKDTELVKTITFKEIKIEVKQYLSIAEKMDIIERVVLGSYEEIEEVKIFNSLLYDTIYNYLLAKFYTNLTLPDDKVLEMYDILKSTGLIEAIIEAIPDDEFDFLNSHVENRISEYNSANEARQGIGHVLGKLLIQYGNKLEESAELNNPMSIKEDINGEIVDKLIKATESIAKDIKTGKE